jgi:2-polyprenyl-3-methyl-5-hydroxy-6-metoxy-1,4-benzoquinol methylase
MDRNYKKTLVKVWSREAENYSADADISPDYLAHYAEVESVIGNLKGKKILDVGSGTGITSAYLAGKGADLYLVDISLKAIGFQKKYFSARGLIGKFFKQDAFAMKFPADYFDAVWNGGVIEHFSDEEKVEMMKKMWKLVKPGGILLITAPNAHDLPFMAAKKILQWRKKWAFGFEDDLTAERMIDLAKKAGVSNCAIYAYNPIVGWWFFPYGKEITNFLGLNKTVFHKIKCFWGHNLVFSAQKTK